MYSELLSIVAFVLGFGGFSVHMQVASIISETDLSLKPYILGKLLQGIIASFYTYMLASKTTFFSWDIIETFNYNSIAVYPAANSANLLLMSLTTITLIAITFKMFRKT